MSKVEINVECSEEAADFFVAILDKLEEISNTEESRTVRLGGQEYLFDAKGSDKVLGFCVNGVNCTIGPRQNRRKFRGSKNTQDNSTVSKSVSQNNLDEADHEKIEDTLIEYLHGDKMFTAYDITTKVRQDGLWVEHADVRKIVEEAFIDNAMINVQGVHYDRSIIDVGTSVKPFLYHLVGADITTYKGELDAED